MYKNKHIIKKKCEGKPGKTVEHNKPKTRMHSSRIRTDVLLTICLLAGGGGGCIDAAAEGCIQGDGRGCISKGVHPGRVHPGGASMLQQGGGASRGIHPCCSRRVNPRGESRGYIFHYLC